jgi:hypothetical protein
MYILWREKEPIEINTDLNKIKERMLYWEKENMGEVINSTGGPIRYSISEIIGYDKKVEISKCCGCSLIIADSNTSGDPYFCNGCVSKKRT